MPTPKVQPNNGRELQGEILRLTVVIFMVEQRGMELCNCIPEKITHFCEVPYFVGLVPSLTGFLLDVQELQNENGDIRNQRNHEQPFCMDGKEEEDRNEHK
ncbi:hypothetical protein SLE2022_347580 [Rubroshorea leprosula]